MHLMDKYNVWLLKIIIISEVKGISYNQPKLCPNAFWNSNATTFATKNTVGLLPYSLFVTANDIVVTVNRYYNRTLAWLNGRPTNHMSTSTQLPTSIPTTTPVQLQVSTRESSSTQQQSLRMITSTFIISQGKFINKDNAFTELYIPARTLPYGLYEVNLIVTMIDYPSLKTSQSVYIRIIPSNPTAKLLPLGTSMIIKGYERNLTFDPGTYSMNSDNNVFATNDWSYEYYCRLYHFYQFPNINGWEYHNSIKSSLTIHSHSLQSNRTYQFMVSLTNRQNSSVQSIGFILVKVENVHSPMIIVGCVISSMCISNQEFQLINPTTQIALFSYCIGDFRANTSTERTIIAYSSISSITVLPDINAINTFMINTQNSSNLFVQLLSSDNQNIVGQLITSLSQQFNQINENILKIAISNNVPITSISITPLKSQSSLKSMTSLNQSALNEYNKQVNIYANIRENLIIFITKLAITVPNSIKLQASSLAQLTQATNYLTRTILTIASDRCYNLSLILYSMRTNIPFEDIQAITNLLMQCATNILTAVNGPLQQRTSVLNVDYFHATKLPDDYDTDLEFDWSNLNQFHLQYINITIILRISVHFQIQPDNQSIYTYFIDNRKTIGHQSIIFGLRELNASEMMKYCSNISIQSPPITNQQSNSTSNYQLRMYTAGCYYFDENNHQWKSDGLIVGPLTNLK
ncbi:hypothetical protein I4U23_005051 [Adineta vaga]|nr:hypothetical protein I4U23_005051 [Adineta vaga]